MDDSLSHYSMGNIAIMDPNIMDKKMGYSWEDIDILWKENEWNMKGKWMEHEWKMNGTWMENEWKMKGDVQKNIPSFFVDGIKLWIIHQYPINKSYILIIPWNILFHFYSMNHLWNGD